jgi:hypothetical protein
VCQRPKESVYGVAKEAARRGFNEGRERALPGRRSSLVVSFLFLRALALLAARSTHTQTIAPHTQVLSLMQASRPPPSATGGSLLPRRPPPLLLLSSHSTLSTRRSAAAIHARAAHGPTARGAWAAASSAEAASTSCGARSSIINDSIERRCRRRRQRQRRRPVAACAATNNDNNNPKDPQRDSWDEEDEDDDAKAAERAVEKLLEPAWRGLKEAAQRELAATAAREGDADAKNAAERLQKMSLSEALEGDRLLKDLAESELGPVLESMGLPRSSALDFLYDLVRTAAIVQLASAAAVFYGAEFLFGLDSGDAWRCVTGLGVGYLARLAIPVEALAWPLYDWLVRAATGGRGYYQGGGEGGGQGARDATTTDTDNPRPPSQREQARTALTRLGILFAAGALLPPLVLGWARDESALQFAFPALAGALAFDAAYLVALVLKLREVEEGGGE